MSEVIYYTSDEVGAPSFSNTVGAFTALLDACLVNGFNARTVTISVTGGVATATASAHGYLAGRKLLIEGAANGALNGVKRIATAPSSNTFTFPAPGVPDGTALGTITAKRAPLGWDIRYTATNKRVYGRTEPGRNDDVLFVDHTVAGTIKYGGAASATDIDTRVEPYGSDSNDWSYTTAGVATPVLWTLVGDGRAFYFINRLSSSPAPFQSMTTSYFGDLIALRPDDNWCCGVHGANTPGSSALSLMGSGSASTSGAHTTTASMAIRRRAGGAVGKVGALVIGAWGSTQPWSEGASLPLSGAPAGVMPIAYPILGVGGLEAYARFALPGLACCAYGPVGTTGTDLHYKLFPTSLYDVPFDLLAVASGQTNAAYQFNTGENWR